MNLFNDFKIKFICKYDNTFWLHLLREFIITFALSWINIQFAVGFAIGFNFSWEWTDGLRNDGFNILDFLAGIIGIISVILAIRI